jgi:transposase
MVQRGPEWFGFVHQEDGDGTPCWDRRVAELSSLCVLDATGKVIREAKVSSEPEALVAFLHGLGWVIARVGLEAGPLSQWLYDGLQKAGFDAVLLEMRHVKAALSAMAIKTDRRDARGIAQLLRMG